MSDVKISIFSDVEDVHKMFFALGRDNRDRFLRYSINQVGRKAYTETIRTMSKNLSMRQYLLRGKAGGKGLIRRHMASDRNLEFSIRARSRHLFISEPFFRPIWSRSRKGVSSMYYGKRRTFKGSFLARGKDSGKIIAFIREGKSRYPIRPIFGFNPAVEMLKEKNSGHIAKKHVPEIAKVYYKKLDGFMSRSNRMKRII